MYNLMGVFRGLPPLVLLYLQVHNWSRHCLHVEVFKTPHICDATVCFILLKDLVSFVTLIAKKWLFLLLALNANLVNK